MKTLLALLVLLTASTIAHAQRDDGTSMDPILKRAQIVIETLEKKEMEVVRVEMDIVAGEKETYRVLSSDWQYGAVAVADDRVEDLDIYVYKEVDDEWVLVKKDES